MASLNSFIFDGKSRSKPGLHIMPEVQQSPQEFLRQVEKARETWMNQAEREKSATKIQTVWRRYRACKLSRNRWRNEFDEICKSNLSSDGSLLSAEKFARNLSDLLQRIQFFFSPRIDGSRLLFVCQQLLAILRRSDLISAEHLSQLIHSHTLRIFVTHCLLYVKHIAASNSPFGPFLRVVQEYAFKDITMIKHVLSSSYMSILLSILRNRIPGSDLPFPHASISKAPSPMAESILESMLSPLHYNDDHIRYEALACLNKEVLSLWPPPSIVSSYIIPAITARLHKESHLFGQLILSTEYARATPASAYFCLSCFKSLQPTIDVNAPYMKMLSMKVSEGLEAILTDVDLVQYYQSVQENILDFDEECEMGLVKPKSSDFNWLTKPKLYFSIRCMELLEDCGIFDAIFYNEEMNEVGMLRLVRAWHVLCKISTSINYSASFMYKWSFQPKFMHCLWRVVTTYSDKVVFGAPRTLLDEVISGHSLCTSDRDRILPLVSLFSSLLTNLLQTVHDHEFWSEESVKLKNSLVPFSLKEWRNICGKLRNVALGLIDLAYPDTKPILASGYVEAIQKLYGSSHTGTPKDIKIADPSDARQWSSLLQSVVKVLQMLHERDTRLQFCGDKFWSYHNKVNHINMKMFCRSARGTVPMFDVSRIVNRDDWEADDVSRTTPPQELRTISILREIPFIVPFNDRVIIFQSLIKQDRQRIGRDWEQGATHNPHANSIVLRLRRNYMYEDAFLSLSKESAPDVRIQFRVGLTNWADADEAGVDGGGLFREFMNEVLKSGFDPARGLFVATPEHTLYPNPLAPLLYEDFERHYFFLGRMLGKLLYENQMVELRFASFFLWKIQSSARCIVDIHHLQSLDPVLHKNLLALKFLDGDCSDWMLDFSVVVDELGVLKTIDLIPDGRNIRVNNHNKLHYISLVVDFYLNKIIHKQTVALRRGMADVIDLDWLGMFGFRELQTLVSGVDKDIDVADMIHHTRITGLPDPHHLVEMFWTTVREMTPEQRSLLLKFFTSCSRPPLLGFKELYPPLNVQIVGGTDRLPTASTCMNLLKLPCYDNIETLKQKLLRAIEAGAGFELS